MGDAAQHRLQLLGSGPLRTARPHRLLAARAEPALPKDRNGHRGRASRWRCDGLYDFVLDRLDLAVRLRSLRALRPQRSFIPPSIKPGLPSS